MMFTKIEDLTAELNETVPIHDHYQYQQFSSPGQFRFHYLVGIVAKRCHVQSTLWSNNVLIDNILNCISKRIVFE